MGEGSRADERRVAAVGGGDARGRPVLAGVERLREEADHRHLALVRRHLREVGDVQGAGQPGQRRDLRARRRVEVPDGGVAPGEQGAEPRLPKEVGVPGAEHQVGLERPRPAVRHPEPERTQAPGQAGDVHHPRGVPEVACAAGDGVLGLVAAPRAEDEDPAGTDGRGRFGRRGGHGPE